MRCMRTLVYIDGFNLFYGCLKHSDDKWLDIHRLFRALLKTNYYVLKDTVFDLLDVGGLESLDR